MALRKELLAEAAQQKLSQLWAGPARAVPPPGVQKATAEAIQRSVNSKTKTYRYVLPTQLLAKAVDSSLDCRSVQATWDSPGAFDARSLCDAVIVPFDRANQNVLGGSTEPYANNPLRIPAVIATHRSQQKDKKGFDDLRQVLDFAESHPELAEALLGLVLDAVRGRLAMARIAYPVPNRVSLGQTQSLLSRYLEERTGGLRLQAVVVALFRTLADRFRFCSRVQSSSINAADASTGNVADLECLDAADSVILAVEVKDRQLTLRHTQDKLPQLRAKGVRELLFLVQGGTASSDAEQVSATIVREFITGQNVYVCELAPFIESCLVLFGEAGRVVFLKHVGAQLDSGRVDLAHRLAWQQLLRET